MAMGRLARIGVAVAALVVAGGCVYDDYGYGSGLQVGAGYGGYYDDYYYDDFAYAPFGWYGGYYYPGNGYYLYDRRGTRRAWNDRERAYWERRRVESASRWRGADSRPWRRDDRGWARPDRPNPPVGQASRPDRGQDNGWQRPPGTDWRNRPDRVQAGDRTPRPDATPGADWRNRAARPDGERRGWRQQGGGAPAQGGWRQRGGGGRSAVATPRPQRPQAAPPIQRAPRAERARAPRGNERPE